MVDGARRGAIREAAWRVEKALENMSVEEVEKKRKAETEALKKEAKEEAKASRMKEKSKTNKVTVETVERTKRKRITTIHGLDLFGSDRTAGPIDWCSSPS